MRINTTANLEVKRPYCAHADADECSYQEMTRQLPSIPLRVHAVHCITWRPCHVGVVFFGARGHDLEKFAGFFRLS